MGLRVLNEGVCAYLIGFLAGEADGAAKKFLVSHHCFSNRYHPTTFKKPVRIPLKTTASFAFILEVLTRAYLRGSPARPSFRRVMTRSFATMASTKTATATAFAGAKPAKLHGRAFYESIGSPKYIVAPMVDQSEFVCLLSRLHRQS